MQFDTNSRDDKSSAAAISQQLERILLDPVFMKSPILRKFLLFIVEQTVKGHAAWLKEYTVGINVLNKPTDFNPQDNCIVRIHAGRLRRALHHYYNTTGIADPIKIFIPKGRYVPVFTENNYQVTSNELSDVNRDITDTVTELLLKEQEAIAIIPFQYFHNDPMVNFLIDGLGLQLSTALMQFKKYTVVAYCTMCDLWKKTNDISKAASLVDVKYLVTGSIQVQENLARAHIQLIDVCSNRQLLSCMYQSEFSARHIFKLQDKIVQFIISEITKSQILTIRDKALHKSLAVVA